MHSIRTKMTGITIAAILTTLLAVFLVCYSTFLEENDRRSVEMMNLIGRNTQQSLEAYLGDITQSVEMAANIAGDSLDSVALVENGAAGTYAKETGQTPEQAARLDEYLAGYSKRLQEVYASIAGHTQGVVTYYYCISPEISQNEHGFFYSKVGKTGYEEQEPLDARELDPEDTDHTVWYYLPIERGRPSWVGPYTAHFLNEMWICSYLVPIYKAGSLIGVLGMDIPLDTLIEQIETIRVFDSGFACLLDEDRHVLYHPDLALGTSPDQLGITGAEELFTQESSGDELLRYTARGKKWQMYFTTLSNGLKLVVTAPTNEINASLNRLVRALLPVTLFVILFFVLLVPLVVGIITRPLQRLTAASKRLASEDYDVELSYEGRDEVGELTTAFAAMRDQIKRDMEDLSRRAYTDALTGLPNMRRFFRTGQALRDRMAAEGKQPAMLYFNLTGMKDFNRQFGFEEGDKLICEIARILSNHYGAENMCCFGQDHFAAVSDEACLTGELNAIFEECQKANNGRTLPLRVGIYPYRLENVNVSVACDRAKYAGDLHRSSYTSGYYYFDNAMLRELEDDRYIISHFEEALKENWISVYYQGIVRSTTGKVCDEEALSRWVDPVRGFLSPAVFVPALEEARLIYRLDLYVVEQVLAKMKRQEEAGICVVPVSVNLSRADFDSCDIVEEIRARVDAAGIGRDMITIEITESIIGSDFTFMKEQVARFRELGFAVWMDDFGSGYSSLDVLQHIRFDLIKFDMRFMESFGEGEEGRIILTELVKMAIGLGVETICEGVETKAQVEFLQKIGCTKIQGYYFARPTAVDALFKRYEEGTGLLLEEPEERARFAGK